MRAVTATLVLAMLTPSAHALPPTPEFQWAQASMDRKLVDACFPSGMRVTIVRDTRQPVASVVSVVGRGAADDPAGRQGAAHLLEHLWFRSRPGGKTPVQATIQQMGARHNAYTYEDATVYVTEAPSHALETMLALEAARLRDPLSGVTEEEIDNERRITRSELALAGDLHVQQLPRLMPPGFLPQDAVNALGPTTPETIDAITLTDLRDVAGTYVPDHTTLRITSDREPDAVLTVVQQAFASDTLFRAPDGSYPEAGSCPPPDRLTLDAPPSRTSQALSATSASVPYPVLMRGWVVPPAYGREEPTYRNAASIAHQRLVTAFTDGDETLSERFAPGCVYLPRLDASVVLCTVRIPTGVAPRAIDAKMADSLAPRMTAEEESHVAIANRLAHIRTLLGVGRFSPLASSDAMRDAISNHSTGRPSWYLDAVHTYMNASPRDAGYAMRDWLGVDQAVAHVVVPMGQPVEPVMTATGGLDAMASDAVTPDPDERGDDPLAPVVSHHAPRALIAPSPETPWPVVRVGDVAEKKLPGGLTLRALQTHDLPMVRTVIASRGGDHVYAPGLDDWAWRLAELDAAELPAFTGRNARYGFLTAGSSIGAVWWTATTREHRMMGFDGSAGNLDEQLWLLRAAVSGVRATTDKAWSKAAEAAVAKATERASPGLVAWRKRAGHLFGDGHPWTKGFYARLADHTDTPRKRIDEQLRATFTPDASIVAIVGGVPAEAAIQRARSMFFDWAPTRVQGAAGGPVAVGDAPGERGVWWVEDPGASRGEIAVTCRMSNDADDAVTRVGAAWLRHRMFGVLRESSIGAYDPAVYTGRWRELRVLEITASVSPSEAGAALEAVFADLEAARDEGPTPDEVAALAYAEAAAFALKVTDDDVVQALLIEHGTDLPAFVAGWPEALRAVQPDAIKAWLGACSGKEAATAVVPSLPSEDEPRGPASRSSR